MVAFACVSLMFEKGNSAPPIARSQAIRFARKRGAGGGLCRPPIPPTIPGKRRSAARFASADHLIQGRRCRRARPDRPLTLDELMQQADAAMYAEKLGRRKMG